MTEPCSNQILISFFKVISKSWRKRWFCCHFFWFRSWSSNAKVSWFTLLNKIILQVLKVLCFNLLLFALFLFWWISRKRHQKRQASYNLRGKYQGLCGNQRLHATLSKTSNFNFFQLSVICLISYTCYGAPTEIRQPIWNCRALLNLTPRRGSCKIINSMIPCS